MLSQTLWDPSKKRGIMKAGSWVTSLLQKALQWSKLLSCSEGRSSSASFHAGTVIWNRYSFQRAFQNKTCSFPSSSIFRFLCSSCYKRNEGQKNKCEANCNIYKSHPSFSFHTHTIWTCSSLKKLGFFSPVQKKKKKVIWTALENTKETPWRFDWQEHILCLLSVQLKWSLKCFPWPCSDTEAAQLTSGRGKSASWALSCFQTMCNVAFTELEVF